MDKINFTGGFLLHKPDVKKWEKAYDEIVPRKRIIIHDLKEQDNIFFATPSCYDSSILKYLFGEKFKFTFYPDINLKNRLDAYYPEEAIKILDAQETVITDKRKMRKYIVEPKPCSIQSLKYKWKPNDNIEQTLTALKLDKEDMKIKTAKSVTTITDRNGKLVAKVSPNTAQGINYALVYPRYGNENLRMIAIDHHSQIITDTTDINYLQEFKERFIRAVKFDKGRVTSPKNKINTDN